MDKSKCLTIAVLLGALSNLASIDATRTSADDVEYKTIETTSGAIRGQVATTLFAHQRYYSFRGIPYAESPLGPLRFKAPRPIAPWPGVRDALEYGPDCMQMGDGKVMGIEDCLFLNVFVPETKTAELPVLFFIHGGRFSIGSSSDELHGPDFLVNENIILVTASYRLGIFGFLALGTPAYSGNMALKDQLLALKWVNANAVAFGADRNRITVAGHGAGGALAHLHALSPASQHYFQRSIVMSGSALNPWALAPVTADDHLWAMFLLAHDLNQTAKNDDELKVILQQVPAEILTEQTASVFYKPGGPEKRIEVRYAPTVESDKDVEPFLLQKPSQIYENFRSNKDSMFGLTSAEMYLLIHRELQEPQLLEEFNEMFRLQLPFANTLKYDSEENIYAKIDALIQHEIKIEPHFSVH